MTTESASTLQTDLDEALNLHRAGHIEKAQSIYLRILEVDPNHADALHFIGVTHYQAGNYSLALSSISRSLEIKPDNSWAYTNLGNVLHKLKHYKESEESFNKALALDPNLIEGYCNRGLLFQEMGLIDQAIADYDQAIRIAPDNAQAYSNKGAALQTLKKYAEALEYFDKAISLHSEFALAHSNRGVILKYLNRPAEALASINTAIRINPRLHEAYSHMGVVLIDMGQYEEALSVLAKAAEIRPDFDQAYLNRGNALQYLEKFDEAIESYLKAIDLAPNSYVAYSNLGAAYKDLKQLHKGLECCNKAIQLNPNYAEAYSNRGLILQSLNQFDEARIAFNTAIELDPKAADFYSNRGLLLQEINYLDEARADFDESIALKPDYAEAHWNRCLLQLLTSNFDEGWRNYEWRKLKRKPNGNKSYPRPLWLGDADLSGKTILIHYEQGFGDTIQFCRYVRELNKLNAKVLFYPQKQLFKLISTLDDAFEIVDGERTDLEFDYHCPLQSLPLAFKTDLSNIPVRTSYLFAEPQKVQEWRKIIGDQGFKIGINWQGSKNNIDVGRSFLLKNYHNLSRIPGVRLISLHKGAGEDQLNDLPPDMRVETLGPGFDAGPDAFIDTAAVMECCDLIISSDTATAHLAGALGLPTWVVLKYVPDWRWLLEREDTPWYPSMRLFRQKTKDGWEQPFAEIEKNLAPLIENRTNRQ